MLKVTEKEKKKNFKGYLSRPHSKVIYQTAKVARQVQNCTKIIFVDMFLQICYRLITQACSELDSRMGIYEYKTVCDSDNQGI